MNQSVPMLDIPQLLLQAAIDLFLRPSPSKREELVRAYVVARLEERGFALRIDEAGNVLATRGTPAWPEGYPLLSFHMDTITAEPEEDLCEPATSSKRRTTALSTVTPALFSRLWDRPARKPTQPVALELLPRAAIAIDGGWIHTRGKRVLGGDDKCGGAIALTLAASTSMPLKIVASVQEEIGCVGIRQVDPAFFADVSYALVLDRRESGDLITRISGLPICTDPFIQQMREAAAAVGHTVRATEGLLSDAVTLARYIWDVVNMSVGYHHPHSTQERVSIADLAQAYHWARQALLTLPLLPPQPMTYEPFPKAKPAPDEHDSFVCQECGGFLIAHDEIAYHPELSRIACLCDLPDLGTITGGVEDTEDGTAYLNFLDQLERENT